MAVSLGLILWFGRGSGFSSDDLYYYARLVNHGIGVDQYDDLSLTYLLAPHNNHLQIAGRLVYEGLFATVGPHYFWYRLIEAIGILLCVGLFFELARTRIGPWPALAPSILLLFYGYAWEALLWPFDLHTVYALAAGLAALLCLERETRWTAPAACILLTLSVAMIELGLAFVIAVAVLLATRRRWSRLWIPAVPAVVYTAWYAWARQFHQPAYHASDPLEVLRTMGEASGAVIGSLLALNSVPNGNAAVTVGTAGWPLLSMVLAALLVFRLFRGPNRPFLWATIALAGAYWLALALTDRPPDSSRYIFAGSVAVLLLAAEALRGLRAPPWLVSVLFVVLALVLPRNIQMLDQGRSIKIGETELNRVEAGAEQLVGPDVDPDFLPSLDPLVVARGGAGPVSITAGQYLSGAARVGPFGYSQTEILSLSEPLRDLGDAVLAGSGDLRSEPISQSARSAECDRVAPESPFAIPSPMALLGPAGRQVPRFHVRFFGESGIPLLGGAPWLRLEAGAHNDRRWEGRATAPSLVCG